MKIDISQDDFGTLCICALRYCHGRRTYMPSRVQGIVGANLKHLSMRDLHIITKDEDFQQCFDLWGDDCDRRCWEEFYKVVKEFKIAGNHADQMIVDDCTWK